jgi:putative membrane protein
MFAIGRTAMSKKYLSVAFAYVGVIVGAGLASGQDLLQYFLSFGAVGLIGIAALGVLNIIFGVVALQLGSYFRSGHHDEVFERITHPAVRRVIDVVLVFSGFAMGFVMLAGAGANLEQQFGLPAWAGSAVCAGLVILTAFLDFDRIMKVIGVFTPMIVIAIIILVIYSLVTPHPSVAELNATATKVTPALPNLWFSAINYFALCVVNGIGMAFVLGGSVLRIREARLAGRIGGAIIALVIGGDALALYLNMDRIWDVNVPALEIARMIHPAFAFVYTLIIFALIYNTVFSLFFATARRFSGGSTTRMRIVLMGVVALGYAASLMGFKKLIGGMYPIIGWLGVALLVVLAAGWLRERAGVSHEEKLRRKLIRLLVHKHADHLEYTDEHREKARELSRASVADSKQLRRDASMLAKDIADRKPNALPSDLVAQGVGER